ncbi:NUDIX domain-containing protein [Leucobacter viscericola]|uniref:8-oxo-dGTP diphosphatase n=1 Tax=Leucobacter viscericola TaxID=2714935 RepID=A0A6G7XBP9_9MICO|nr:NUDIX domain-containing protein [Leucobacter viscericola]QIK62030.1 NUDIX domain-containing protein [Leucobacter viscericola]
MDPRPEHRVSCGLLFSESRVLLVHRSPSRSYYPDVWDFPGGHIEPGENGRETIVRELQEELNVEIAIPAGEAIFQRRTNDLHLEVWIFEEWRGTVVSAEPEEHDSLGWFTLQEALALELADDAYPEILKRVLA